MNRNKREKKNRYLLTVITILCIGAMVLSAANFFPVASVRRAVGNITLPLEKGIHRIADAFSDVRKGHQDARVLAEENERLQGRIDALEEENTLLRENESELARLQELYELDRNYESYEKVAAQVISREAGNWYTTFLINRGSDAGVDVDMNVLGGGGLVGIVTEVGSDWARVRPIIDEQASVSAMTLNDRYTCIVSGDLDLQTEGKIAFSQLSKDVTVSVGEKLITSSISEKYLEGILIGYIDSVEEDTNHLMQVGTILPAADFSHLDEVLVILKKKMPEGAEEG